MHIWIAFFLTVSMCAVNANDPYKEIDVFGYHRKFGIPIAIKVRKAEEVSLIVDAMEIRGIVGGAHADIAEVPYQVGLVISLLLLLTSVCGGSLITDKRVLTAAHCYSDGILKANSFTVVMGSNKLFFGGLRIDTTDVSVHPDWNPKKIENDLCILRIPTVAFTDVIQAIALPSHKDVWNTFAGWTAIASGYGITSDNSSIRMGQLLSAVRLTVISNDECASFFGSELIQNANICTSGDNGQSTCRGDSGGPLVVYIEHHRVLIGVTSFGSRASCESGYPAAYSRVSHFLPWIISQ
ncbi:brachyurin-like [Maniola hyperantus]|uniref:brachyurin-like n=1 Tax=Aphantopus hyperantus TaxID=2795564 RepID=UPI001567E82C|nr:brachyurin-like [Maniola hyperantus]